MNMRWLLRNANKTKEKRIINLFKKNTYFSIKKNMKQVNFKLLLFL